MKTVFTSVFQDEALVLRSLLESAGIASEILVDGMLDINPLFSTDIKGAKVIVADSQEEDALLVVEDYRKVHTARS